MSDENVIEQLTEQIKILRREVKKGEATQAELEAMKADLAALKEALSKKPSSDFGEW